MKEHSILFNGPMVRAILEGRKTQTRRIITPQPYESEYEPGLFHVTYRDDKRHLISASGGIGMWEKFCPYGQPGDRLWVREAFAGPLVDYDEWDRADYDKYKKPEYCKYMADGGPTPEWIDDDDEWRSGWTPSIHMPRWASRIILEIVSVRVERLQDIREEDAEAEGADAEFETDLATFINRNTNFDSISTYRLGFKHLWDSLYAKRGFGWDENPWVWVVSFKRVPI